MTDRPNGGLPRALEHVLAAAAGTVALGVGGSVLLSAGSRPDPAPVTAPVQAPQDDEDAGASDARPAQDDASGTPEEESTP